MRTMGRSGLQFAAGSVRQDGSDAPARHWNSNRSAIQAHTLTDINPIDDDKIHVDQCTPSLHANNRPPHPRRHASLPPPTLALMLLPSVPLEVAFVEIAVVAAANVAPVGANAWVFVHLFVLVEIVCGGEELAAVRAAQRD